MTDETSCKEFGQPLTKRERQVQALLCLGWSNKEIGVKLLIGARTVEDYRGKVFKKIGVRNAVELVRFVYGIKEFGLEVVG